MGFLGPISSREQERWSYVLSVLGSPRCRTYDLHRITLALRTRLEAWLAGPVLRLDSRYVRRHRRRRRWAETSNVDGQGG